LHGVQGVASSNPATPTNWRMRSTVFGHTTRKEADEMELDDGEPGKDENAAGFLKNATDKPDKE
jgi:hypothetical protein